MFKDVPGYTNWRAMIYRCSCRKIPRYGGRGIVVCDRWKSFPNFVSDMGVRPSKSHTIERIDGDSDYSPWNCRWATRAEQAVNTARNVYLEFNGERRCISEWARRCGLSIQTIIARMKRSDDPSFILSPRYTLRRGERSHAAKLTSSEVRGIREALASKSASRRKLSVSHGVSYGAIVSIETGRTWAGV